MPPPTAPESSRPESVRSGRIGFGARLRTYFLAGILATAPVCLTVYIAWRFITWVDEGVFALLRAAILLPARVLRGPRAA